MVRLRAERAKLFGFKNHAEYVISAQTAGNASNVHGMLRQVASPAVRNARAEGADIQRAIGQEFELQSWDWDFYTEKVRVEKYNLDTTKMRPYFELERVLHDGIFFAAEKLFGITFKERKDLITYHPEARSQVNEMWILWPEVVRNYARHFETGEVLPQEWIDKLHESSTFNEGHATTSYLAAAILDLAWHELEEDSIPEDVNLFEAEAIRAYGLDYPPVPTRYRSTYFAHIFAGGYSAGYYGYIWSEVLDADTVEWFKENGGLTRSNGDHFRRTLLGCGGSIDSMQMFRNFRGRDKKIEPLLKRRGLN